MDAIIILIGVLVLCLINAQEREIDEGVLIRETRLNPEFYEDENAFMEVANVLGFGVDSSDAGNTGMDVWT